MTTLRTPRSLRTAILAGAALLGAGATALAAPTQPTVLPQPEFAQGPVHTVSWSDAAFSPLSAGREYEVLVEDLTTGVPANPFTGLTRRDLAVVSGHQYRVRVRAKELPCIIPNQPGTACLLQTPPNLPSFGPYSEPRVFRADGTAPEGTVQVNGGAAFTNSRSVTLGLEATDPPSNGLPQSGLGGVDLSQNGLFPCSQAPGGDRSGCPVPVAPALAYTLDEGPDGPRTVTARYRDKASPFQGIVINPGPIGNTSAPVSDTIVLDRAAPTAVVDASAAAVAPGRPVTLDASRSTDGAGTPADSGIDPASYAWQFGDGTTGTGPTVSHTYPSAGTFTGTLSIRDRAGNAASATFTVQVAAATAAGSPEATRLGPIQPVTGFRRFRRAAIRVSVSPRGTVTGRLLRLGPGARRSLVRTFRATGGPGAVVLRFTSPRAGRYLLRVSAGGATRARVIRVR